VTQDRFEDNPPRRFTKHLGTIPTYYELLDLPSSATIDQIRRAYRLKSKLYHPDTTVLAPEVATQKFRELKEAYTVLNSPEHRALYDMGQRPVAPVGDFSQDREASSSDRRFRSSASAFLDPKERPLSPGEIFAVFLLGITFVICLVLAIVLGVARGEMVLQAGVPSANNDGRDAIALKSISMPPSSPFFPKPPLLKERQLKVPQSSQASPRKRSPFAATDRKSIT
jgi:curved DNA-binding protein CbpA